MALHLIIDGYNLIRQNPFLAQEEEVDLQNGREALLALLAAYRHQRRYPLTVVFDAWGQGQPQDRRDYYQGIEIIYSRLGEKADEVIKRLIQREGPRAMVVTSDRELQDYAAHRGAAFLSAAAFSSRLAAVLDGEPEDDETKPTHSFKTEKKGPARRLPKKLRRWRLRTRKV